MEEETPYISKSQKKREAHALQQLGLELAELPVQVLKQMDLPEKLRQALIDGKEITANVAARRHRQYIGVLMREIDPDAVRQAMTDQKYESLAPNPVLEQVQEWKDRLLADPDLAEDCLTAFPALDRQQLRQVIRNAGREMAAQKPGKSVNRLESLLREAISQ